eukprot:1145806-Pelagomonas_calceolata.AAC.3
MQPLAHIDTRVCLGHQLFFKPAPFIHRRTANLPSQNHPQKNSGQLVQGRPSRWSQQAQHRSSLRLGDAGS